MWSLAEMQGAQRIDTYFYGVLTRHWTPAMRLRCMNAFTNAHFVEHLESELIYRKELCSGASTATTIHTAIVFMLIYIFYFY
ncbi:MAG: hypothetical protein NVSMB26_23310 [Beijerinckiaceae bacterium]